ncbi:MAG: type 1 glutamine amidotransferase [Candidatus Omnitrophota bacterium]|nr:type 1 glutamine amidotransferase [Candidatus Omnitrophota bacterium]MDZ4242011.1 type 1 glutamine amidotransferase [Candidatus Omnitrophota bacterium]
MILIIKHIGIEGPALLGDYLQERGIRSQVIDLGAGDALPLDSKAVDAVVVLGGPMNVDEEDRYPFLKPENIFIQNILKKRIPFLGICLGSQLLAKAAGAKVVKSPAKEVGWFDIQLTDAGKRDPFFNALAPELRVYQWHEDMFMIPAGGELLATAPGCPHQAFRVGENAYGLQFHCEITDRSITEWCDEYLKNHPRDLRIKKAGMLEEYRLKKAEYFKAARQMFGNFVKIIESKRNLAAGSGAQGVPGGLR